MHTFIPKCMHTPLTTTHLLLFTPCPFKSIGQDSELMHTGRFELAYDILHAICQLHPSPAPTYIHMSPPPMVNLNNEKAGQTQLALL